MEMSPASIDLAVIGGTGLYQLAALENVRTVHADTRYGPPSAPIRIGQLAGKTVAFMARHGEGHALPPHKINYRANLSALKELGVRDVLAINAVGGISDYCAPRALVLADQIIDYTYGRLHTLSEEPGSEVLHVDFGEPYSGPLRDAVLAAANDIGVHIHAQACYGATQGPRLETKAEIRRMRQDGCDLVGMTGMPEAGLARELGLHYACLSIVANWAAGCGDEAEISLDEVLANVAEASTPLPGLVSALLLRIKKS